MKYDNYEKYSNMTKEELEQELESCELWKKLTEDFLKEADSSHPEFEEVFNTYASCILDIATIKTFLN